MYNVSNDYISKIMSDNYSYEWYGTLTDINGVVYNLTTNDFKAGANRWTREITGGNCFTLGTTCSAQIRLSLFLDGDGTNYYLDNKLISSKIFLKGTVTLTFRLHYDDGHAPYYEDVPCGIFTVVESTRTANTLSLTCNDNMSKFDQAPISLSTPLSAYQYLTTICTYCNMQLGNTQAEIDDMLCQSPLMDDLIVYPGIEFKSWKEILSQLACLLSACAIIGRDGKLYLKQWPWYTDTPQRTISPSWRYSSNLADFDCRYTSIRIENKARKTQNVYTLVGSPIGLTFDLGPNAFMQNLSPSTESTWSQFILTNLAGAFYNPFEITCPSDPSLDIMDLLLLTGNQAGINGVTGGITNIDLSLMGSMKVQCKGINPELQDVKGTIGSAVSEIAESGAEGSIRYYDFVNPSAITVNSSATTTVDIEFKTEKKTHINFHCQILGQFSNVTDDPTVTFEYYLNGSKINNFVPIETPSLVSANDIRRIWSLHYTWTMDGGYESTFRVKMKVTGATITIPAYGINAWIEGCGLVDEEEGGQSEKPWKDTQIEVDEITFTENGTYTPAEKHAYGPVTVNVSGGGGPQGSEIQGVATSNILALATVRVVGPSTGKAEPYTGQLPSVLNADTYAAFDGTYLYLCPKVSSTYKTVYRCPITDFTDVSTYHTGTDSSILNRRFFGKYDGGNHYVINLVTGNQIQVSGAWGSGGWDVYNFTQEYGLVHVTGEQYRGTQVRLSDFTVGYNTAGNTSFPYSLQQGIKFSGTQNRVYNIYNGSTSTAYTPQETIASFSNDGANIIGENIIVRLNRAVDPSDSSYYIWELGYIRFGETTVNRFEYNGEVVKARTTGVSSMHRSSMCWNAEGTKLAVSLGLNGLAIIDTDLNIIIYDNINTQANGNGGPLYYFCMFDKYILINGTMYEIPNKNQIIPTSSKNANGQLGYVQQPISAGQTGTAIILFS